MRYIPSSREFEGLAHNKFTSQDHDTRYLPILQVSDTSDLYRYTLFPQLGPEGS